MSVLTDRLLNVLGQTGRVAISEKAILARLQEIWPTEHGYKAEFIRTQLEQLRDAGIIHCSASGKWTKFLNRMDAAAAPKPEPPVVDLAPASPIEAAPEPAEEPKPTPREEATVATNKAKAKTCSSCGTDKPIAEFPKIGAQCKACISEKAKAAYAAKKGGGKPKSKTGAKAIANLRAKSNGHNGASPLIQRQFILSIEDVEGGKHKLIVAADVVQRLAAELREHA